jgi:Caspase domain
MLSRRSFAGGLAASLPVALIPGDVRAQTTPRLHAIVVGIDTYTGRGADGRPVSTLKGCLNDAADIERQVKKYRPTTLVRLGWDAAAGRERPVTRVDFFRAWGDTLAAAHHGDTLLLTFAGHAGKVPVLPGNPSGEADELDEVLVLTGYSASDGRNGDIVIDDELNEMFLAARAKGVRVVFVADCIHAGGLVSPTSIPPNLLFLGASQENQVAPEIRDPSTGLYRGALSIAVARALEGGAATDGEITALSLVRFVRRHVRLLRDSIQDPGIRWPTLVTALGVDDGRVLFALAKG